MAMELSASSGDPQTLESERHGSPSSDDCCEFSVAVAGGPGVGKTVLIQALLGLNENSQHSRAASLHPTRGEGPLLYLHPSHPGLTLWELPLEDGSPENWISEADLLLLVTDTQFSHTHVKFAESALALGKKVCLVRTKVDCDLHTLKRRMKDWYRREDVLLTLQAVTLQPFSGLKKENFPRVFLVSCFEPRKLDAPGLKEEIEKTSIECGRPLSLAQQGYEIIGDKEIEELQSALERGGISEMVRFIQTSLDTLLDTRFNLALMGGNSDFRHSLLNALRGVRDGEDGSAHGGNPETPIEYPSLKYPKASLWDLPVMGELESQPKKYLESVHISHYDLTFLHLTPWQDVSDSYTSLVSELKKEGRKVFFIQECEGDVVESMQGGGGRDKEVFVLFPSKLPGPEFHRLLGCAEKQLPSHKCRALILSLPNISAEVIQKKKEALSQEIWKVALLSSLVASVPVPGVGIVCDMSLLTARLDTYRQELGLDASSLASLSHSSGVPVAELMSEVHSPAGKGVTRELVGKLLGSATGLGLEIAGVILHRFPLLGHLTSGGIAFHASYLVLSRCLEAMSEDAQRVLARATASD
ncbi:interferon-inducible GTPase 5-like [Spea bombifrons]|uniref:interferon-inducible GTPase 5-like n=1 Tax=Spea bombifrons TaxID=233779 RepID=UPI002349265A|nr:interferon-inducible GTPase 5-like [Spea bombifrons]